MIDPGYISTLLLVGSITLALLGLWAQEENDDVVLAAFMWGLSGATIGMLALILVFRHQGIYFAY